jgi:maleate isomerase
MLALNEILERTAVRRIGFVTPYLDDVQARIVANYASLGVGCAAERHLGVSDNFSFSEVSEGQIREMTRQVAAARPDAIAIICTNLRGAPLVEELERELGVPIYETISTVVWKSLLLAGVAPKRVTGWGRLFRELG